MVFRKFYIFILAALAVSSVAPSSFGAFAAPSTPAQRQLAALLEQLPASEKIPFGQSVQEVAGRNMLSMPSGSTQQEQTEFVVKTMFDAISLAVDDLGGRVEPLLKRNIQSKLREARAEAEAENPNLIASGPSPFDYGFDSSDFSSTPPPPARYSARQEPRMGSLPEDAEAKVQVLVDAYLESMNAPEVKAAFDKLEDKKNQNMTNYFAAVRAFNDDFDERTSGLSYQERRNFSDSLLGVATLRSLAEAAKAKNTQRCAELIIESAAEKLGSYLTAQQKTQMIDRLKKKIDALGSAQASGVNAHGTSLLGSASVMGTVAGVSLLAYVLVLNDRWAQEVRTGKTKLSRVAYISKEIFSVRLKDWTTYLKFFVVGTAGVAIYNQVTK